MTAGEESAQTPAQHSAPVRSAVTAGTVDKDSSASSHVTPAWRSRKSVPVGRPKSVEDLLSILESRPVPTPPGRPVRAALQQVETEDVDSEEQSGDDNNIKLDDEGSESGGDDHLNFEDDFICDDKDEAVDIDDDQEDKDDDSKEDSEGLDEEGEKPVPKPLSIVPGKVNNKKVAAESVTKRVRTKKPVTTSTSSIVQANSFYAESTNKTKSPGKKPATRARTKK